MSKIPQAPPLAAEVKSSRGGDRVGAGRPPVENPRNIPYQLRLTQGERDKLDRVAAAAGQAPADWLRDRIARAKDPLA